MRSLEEDTEKIIKSLEEKLERELKQLEKYREEEIARILTEIDRTAENNYSKAVEEGLKILSAIVRGKRTT